MNKKGASMAINLVIVIAMLLATFFVWKFGILDRLVGIIGSVGYQIDTTQMDICQGIGEKRKGTDLIGSGLTDNDNDELPDYICDTCVCRDGYGGRGYDRDGKCVKFAQPTFKNDDLDSVSGSLGENIKCIHGDYEKDKGLISENNFCSTNNMDIATSDTDNDFLPDVCDNDPERFNQGKSLKCHKGPIYLIDDDRDKQVILGVVYPDMLENGLMENTAQCVLAVCTPLNNKLYKDRAQEDLYFENCPLNYCSGSGTGSNDFPDTTELKGNYEKGNKVEACYCVEGETNKFEICPKGSKCNNGECS